MSIIPTTFQVDIFNGGIGKPINKKSSWKEVEEKIINLWNAIPIFGLHNEDDLPLYPKYENFIIRNSIYSTIYASCFVKGAFLKGEDAISKNAYCSYFYAFVCLKKRFEKGEDAIATDPRASLEYCINIFKRKKLPDNMHRKMLAFGIKDSDNQYVKRYFSFKGVTK